MKNQNVKISIEDFEDKKAKSGKRYTRFKTSQGWMSAFDKEIIDALKEAEKSGSDICVEVATDEEKGFKNIRSIVDENDVVETIKPSELGKSKVQQEIKVEKKDTTTMYVSYAKDIFCAIAEPKLSELKNDGTTLNLKELMDISIALVKQAKSEFENGKSNTDNKQK